MNKQDLQWPPSDDLVHVQELEVALEREFPSAAEGFSDGLSRRRWLQLMGASLALGGMLGCRDNVEKIVPFAFRPKNRIPGIPQKFATTVDFNGIGMPLLATCNDGRPTKLDGNPDHPAFQGGSNVFLQAMVLDLYDPDRSRFPQRKEGNSFLESSYLGFLDVAKAMDLSKMAVLSEPNSSPTLARLKDKMVEAGVKWFEYASVNQENQRDAIKTAFGASLRPHYRFEKAKVVVTLDADPLGMDVNAVEDSRTFISSRDAAKGWMSRLYSVESTYSITGGQADHRIAIPSSMIGSFLADLEMQLGEIEKLGSVPAIDKNASREMQVLMAMAGDLYSNKGAGIVVVGERQSSDVHERALRINSNLGNVGETIEFTEPYDSSRRSFVAQLDELQGLMDGEKLESLLVIGGNPVYDAPSADAFVELLDKVPNTVHFSVYHNETSRACGWHVNAANPLESWGDAVSYDGTWCIAQPLIAPIFGGRSTIEFLADLIGVEGGALEMVKETAKEQLGSDDFESMWIKAVHDGFVAGSAAKPRAVELKAFDSRPGDVRWRKGLGEDELEVVFETSRSVYDGRFANNGWLQELPDFFTKLTWDNALMVGPITAEKHRLEQGSLASVKLGDGEVKLPVMVQPRQAEGTLVLEIGYGRQAAGRVGGDTKLDIDPVGQNVNVLRSVEGWHYATGAEVVRTTSTYMMATTQEPATMDTTARQEINRRMGPNSALLRRGTFESFQDFNLDNHDGDDHGDKSAGLDRSNLPVGQAPVVHGKTGNPENGFGNGSLSNGSLTIGALTSEAGLTNVSFKEDEKPQSEGHDDEHHSWPPGHHEHHEFDLTPGPPLREDVKWGMSIDLNKCTGCNACVIACQSENNIPIVGKEQVWRGREMHWLRIDRYYPAPEDQDSKYYEHADVVLQPVACHHCENAPCETVCPVAATVHSDEGLNDMVYNRCIGTRYCGNNCPYKVRRFNYLNYSNAQTFIKYPGADAWPVGGGALSMTAGSTISAADKQLMGLVFNPEVTIRSRGVMEKCTYCVQRIQNTKIEARNESRPIGSNEIRTACQDACSSQAIEFGNLADKDSRVHAAHNDVRAYTMLQELNNKPRTKYLARITNPHPELVVASGHGGNHDSEEKQAATNPKKQEATVVH